VFSNTDFSLKNCNKEATVQRDVIIDYFAQCVVEHKAINKTKPGRMLELILTLLGTRTIAL
jgi:hypothetical protein